MKFELIDINDLKSCVKLIILNFMKFSYIAVIIRTVQLSWTTWQYISTLGGNSNLDHTCDMKWFQWNCFYAVISMWLSGWDSSQVDQIQDCSVFSLYIHGCFSLMV